MLTLQTTGSKISITSWLAKILPWRVASKGLSALLNPIPATTWPNQVHLMHQRLQNFSQHLVAAIRSVVKDITYTSLCFLCLPLFSGSFKIYLTFCSYEVSLNMISFCHIVAHYKRALGAIHHREASGLACSPFTNEISGWKCEWCSNFAVMSSFSRDFFLEILSKLHNQNLIRASLWHKNQIVLALVKIREMQLERVNDQSTFHYKASGTGQRFFNWKML